MKTTATAMVWTALLALSAVAAGKAPAPLTSLIHEQFERLGRPWRRIIRGNGAIRRVPGGVSGTCLEVVSRNQALAYYSRRLDAKKVAGKTLFIRCKVRLAGVRVGPKSYSTAKIHVGVETSARRRRNFARRFTGTAGWHDEFLEAAIPEDAVRVVLDLGIQQGTGTAWFDDLRVWLGRPGRTAVSIASIANTNFRDDQAGDGFGFLDDGLPDLRRFPCGPVRFRGVDFYILCPYRNFGRTCAVLAGRDYPRFPKRIETVVPVKRAAQGLVFLVAGAGESVRPGRICLVCLVHFGDGREARMQFREGVDIGRLRAPHDCSNWKLVWRDASGPGIGLSHWRNPFPAVPIDWLRFSSPGAGLAPLVVGIAVDPGRESSRSADAAP